MVAAACRQNVKTNVLKPSLNAALEITYKPVQINWMNKTTVYGFLPFMALEEGKELILQRARKTQQIHAHTERRDCEKPC